MLSPEQFKDWGNRQLSLFPDLPSGQPDMGMTRGNPGMPLYRSVVTQTGVRELEHQDFDLNDAADRRMVASAILHRVNERRSDRGHATRLGIHWQHEHDYASDLADNLDREHNSTSRRFHTHTPVIVEADHPGHEHVVGFDYDHRQGPPEEVTKRGMYSSPSGLGREARDWRVINDTVGPHNLLDAMQPEVPVRPGAPLTVRALHVRNPADDQWHRIPVNHRGEA